MKPKAKIKVNILHCLKGLMTNIQLDNEYPEWYFFERFFSNKSLSQDFINQTKIADLLIQYLKNKEKKGKIIDLNFKIYNNTFTEVNLIYQGKEIKSIDFSDFVDDPDSMLEILDLAIIKVLK